MNGTHPLQRQAILPLCSQSYDPFAELACMAARKQSIQELLQSERAKDSPEHAVVTACETWLRVYQRETQRIAFRTNHETKQGSVL